MPAHRQPADPSVVCPFCDPDTYVDEWEWTGDRVRGYGIYRAVPLGPVVPGHRLFIPQRHVTDAATDPTMTGAVFEAAARYAAEQAVAFNLITSAGAAATQTMPHLHVHYVPRHSDDELHLPWTPRVA